jgi:hypothetical protein
MGLMYVFSKEGSPKETVLPLMFGYMPQPAAGLGYSYLHVCLRSYPYLDPQQAMLFQKRLSVHDHVDTFTRVLRSDHDVPDKALWCASCFIVL